MRGIVAMHRFAEVSIGIAVGLAITALWPESEQPRVSAFRKVQAVARSGILDRVFRLRF